MGSTPRQQPVSPVAAIRAYLMRLAFSRAVAFEILWDGRIQMVHVNLLVATDDHSKELIRCVLKGELQNRVREMTPPFTETVICISEEADRALASDPNTDVATLVKICPLFYREVKANPVLNLLSMEDPQAYQRLLTIIDRQEKEAFLAK